MVFSRTEWMLARRYLKGKRREHFISVISLFSLLGILLGVATLIIVMSVMNGFRQEMLTRILGINGHIIVHSRSNTAMPNYKNVAETIMTNNTARKEIENIVPLTEGQVMLGANGRSTGGMVRGVYMSDLAKYPLVKKSLFGTTFEQVEPHEVIIGQALAQKLGLGVGGEITITSAKGNVTAFGMMPRIRSYRIAGLFDIGMYEYDSTFVFMPMEASQVYFNMPSSASHIEIFIKNPDDSARTKQLIQVILGPDYRVMDWRDLNSQYFNALDVERNVMFIILTLIILVAAFNIISGLVMLVKDKGRDIAILRTMGLSRNGVMRVFFFAGAYIGVLGTAIGSTAGILFCVYIEQIRKGLQSMLGLNLFSEEIYFLSKLPAKIEAGEVITVVMMALILTFLAALYPAWRASKLDPAEALRYE
ncbi:MAG: lipoprotein-releasing ABC transporter permease subunit [Alphaproteobacteria bacterium]|nr:lipoprotein-releasing ABC transporter permease subunit [Alphaproteobacteria bacterium]MBN2780000.1 lipoprotein-releasing ABC transporter permease subunit [Alphaproteobacteria bacterium]